MMKKASKNVFFTFLILLSALGTCPAYTLLSLEYGPAGVEFEADPYYTDIAVYSGLFRNSTPYLGEESEENIYKYLFNHAFLPKFLLAEASCYPFPYIGTLIRKNNPELYERANVTDSINAINALFSGYEEPNAYSFFLGNIVSFKPKDIKADIKGKAYMGYLYSFGNYHIRDSEIFNDKWFELEWKIKGARISDKRTIEWSYRAGTKQHENSGIKDVIYLSIWRDRIDFVTAGPSLFNNTLFEYIIDLDYNNLSVIRHFFLAGKSFPLHSRRMALQIKMGFVWEKSDKYTGPLERKSAGDAFMLMFRPNLKF